MSETQIGLAELKCCESVPAALPPNIQFPLSQPNPCLTHITLQENSYEMYTNREHVLSQCKHPLWRHIECRWVEPFVNTIEIVLHSCSKYNDWIEWYLVQVSISYSIHPNICLQFSSICNRMYAMHHLQLFIVSIKFQKTYSNSNYADCRYIDTRFQLDLCNKRNEEKI